MQGVPFYHVFELQFELENDRIPLDSLTIIGNDRRIRPLLPYL